MTPCSCGSPAVYVEDGVPRCATSVAFSPPVVALCADCGGAEMPGHECAPEDIERRRLVAIMESTLRHPMDDAQRAVVDRAVDEYLMDDDRGYSTEDDDRVAPPAEEGEQE